MLIEVCNISVVGIYTLCLVTNIVYTFKEGQGEMDKTSSLTQVGCDSQHGVAG